MKTSLSKLTQTAALALLMNTLMPVGTSALYATEQVTDDQLESFYLNDEDVRKKNGNNSFSDMKAKGEDNKEWKIFRKNVLKYYNQNQASIKKSREISSQKIAAAEQSRAIRDAEAAMSTKEVNSLNDSELEQYFKKIENGITYSSKNQVILGKHGQGNELGKSYFYEDFSLKTYVQRDI